MGINYLENGLDNAARAAAAHEQVTAQHCERGDSRHDRRCSDLRLVAQNYEILVEKGKFNAWGGRNKTLPTASVNGLDVVEDALSDKSNCGRSISIVFLISYSQRDRLLERTVQVSLFILPSSASVNEG